MGPTWQPISNPNFSFFLGLFTSRWYGKIWSKRPTGQAQRLGYVPFSPYNPFLHEVFVLFFTWHLVGNCPLVKPSSKLFSCKAMDSPFSCHSLFPRFTCKSNSYKLGRSLLQPGTRLVAVPSPFLHAETASLQQLEPPSRHDAPYCHACSCPFPTVVKTGVKTSLHCPLSSSLTQLLHEPTPYAASFEPIVCPPHAVTVHLLSVFLSPARGPYFKAEGLPTKEGRELKEVGWKVGGRKRENRQS